MEKQFDKFKIKFNNKQPHINIVGIIKDDNDVSVKYFCTKCKQYFTKSWAKSLYCNGCPICANKLIIKGVNDVATTHPWVLQYFVNKEDAYSLPYGTQKRVKLKCPICGKIKTSEVLNLINCGFRCDYCSDNVSFPNKFSRAILENLNVDNLQVEYSPIWIAPKRYDNYFEYKGNKYILEMDGGFHFINNTYTKDSVEISKNTDKYKDDLAKKHGIEVIRIDCRDLNPFSIKNKIEESKLKEIFDLSIVDWQECIKKGSGNLLIEACELFNKYKMSVSEISKKLQMTRGSIRKYLKIGTECGLCNYDLKNCQNSKFKVLYLYRNGNFIGTYKGFSNLIKYLEKNHPNINFNLKCIQSMYYSNRHYCKYKGFIISDKEITD